MCRGLALGYDIDKCEVICHGISSHTDTLKENEDKYIKLEIIVDDSAERGFVLELDSQYYHNNKLDNIVKQKFGAWLTLTGMSDRLNNAVEKWISENEKKVLRWLLTNQSYKRAEESINNSWQKAEEFIDNGYQKAEESINNRCQRAEESINNTEQKAKEFIDNGYQKAEESIYNSYQKAKEFINNSWQKAEESIDNTAQKAEKSINNSYQKAEKSIDNTAQKAEESINNSYQKAEKFIYIAFTCTGNKEVTGWIQKESKKNNDLSLDDLILKIIKLEKRGE